MLGINLGESEDIPLDATIQTLLLKNEYRILLSENLKIFKIFIDLKNYIYKYLIKFIFCKLLN